jgi:hypothetical protein
MQMQVPSQLLIPRMQHQRKPKVTAELTTSEQLQRLRRRIEQRFQQRR